mmetsp:Transcript_16046/g.60680  ORF Transcript_16046/g.60680 Transcript_16046/m.60680 type:complete len:298 (+) Transcript_16046:625-1518(+)
MAVLLLTQQAMQLPALLASPLQALQGESRAPARMHGQDSRRWAVSGPRPQSHALSRRRRRIAAGRRCCRRPTSRRHQPPGADGTGDKRATHAPSPQLPVLRRRHCPGGARRTEPRPPARSAAMLTTEHVQAGHRNHARRGRTAKPGGGMTAHCLLARNPGYANNRHPSTSCCGRRPQPALPQESDNQASLATSWRGPPPRARRLLMLLTKLGIPGCPPPGPLALRPAHWCGRAARPCPTGEVTPGHKAQMHSCRQLEWGDTAGRELACKWSWCRAPAWLGQPSRRMTAALSSETKGS